MKPSTKKYLTWIVIALVLFYLFRDPTQAAETVRDGVAKLGSLAEAVITFLQNLFA
ncbi:MAG: hypothetical protein ACRDTF_08420 [Pseudonocardiaceae bacterium]